MKVEQNCIDGLTLLTNIPGGRGFFYDGELFMKVSNPVLGTNAVNLDTGATTLLSDTVRYQMAHVKIVRDEEHQA